MPATTSELGSVTVATPTPTTASRKRRGAMIAPSTEPSIVEAGLDWSSADRKKFGIPPKGAGPHPDSAYGFPLPPKGHPKAKAAARAVLSRAHQSENFDPADVAKQVRKARAILGDPAKESGSSGTAVTACLVPFRFREVDGDPKGTARVIIIREGPGNIGDRHYYTAQALIDSVNAGVWEGVQAFFDHPTPTEDREIPERSVKNLAGWFSEARIVDYTDPELGTTAKAIEAIFHPQVGEEKTLGLMRTQAEYAKAFPSKAYFGLSINACGDGEPAEIDGQQWNRVDQITEAVSVDFVTRAGAGGKQISFRESYRVATTLKKVDPLKIVEAHVADARSAVRKFLEDAAITLTPQQDQALDASLGIVDGSKLDQLLDAATNVSPADDEDDDDDEEEDDMHESAEEQEAREKREREAADAGGEEITEADLAPFKGKSPEELMTIAARMHKKMNKPEPGAKPAPAPAAEADDEAAMEKRESMKRVANAERALKERIVKDVLAAQNVPDAHRPILTRHLMERAALKTESQIAGYATEYVQAYVVTQDGAGRTIRESGVGSNKINITFAAQRAYAD